MPAEREMPLKKCPLQLATAKTTTDYDEANCIEEKCAWYDDASSACAILGGTLRRREWQDRKFRENNGNRHEDNPYNRGGYHDRRDNRYRD